MSSYDVLQNNFPNGELSPLWKGRSNSDLYRTGLDTCLNFMPLSPSGLRRRPGTVYLRTTFDSSEAIIVPVTIGYKNAVLEIVKGKARIWYSSDPETILADVEDEKLEFADDIKNIRYALNKNVLWIVNEQMKPITITIGNNPISLTVAEPTFTGDVTFSEEGDYPQHIAFKGGRLILGGTLNTPNAIFTSRAPDYSSETPDRYTDFTYGTNADDAIEVEDNELTEARWFFNSQRFLVGSPKCIFSDDGSAITPSTFDIAPTLREGSSYIQAKGLKNYVVFAGPSGKTLSVMIYDSDSEQYISRIITTNSSHLFSSGIKDFTIAFMPDPIIWVLLNNGEMLSCTIDTSTGAILTGWARHTFSNDRSAVSISTITDEDGRDEIYIQMKMKDSEENDIYHIEALRMNDIFNSDELGIYLDMATEYNGVSSNRVYYNSLMAGAVVSCYSDGAILPEAVVEDDGYVTLDRNITNGIIGISFRSVAGFLSQEQPTNGQSSFGNKRRIKKITLRTYQSFGGYVGLQADDISKMYKLLSEKYGDLKYGEPFELTDEDYEVDIQSRNITIATLYITTDYPTPMNILALKEKMELLEV